MAELDFTGVLPATLSVQPSHFGVLASQLLIDEVTNVLLLVLDRIPITKL